MVTQLFENDKVKRMIDEKKAGINPETVYHDRGSKIYDRMDFEMPEHIG